MARYGRGRSGGGCKPVCSFIGAAIMGAAALLVAFGGYTSAWQSVQLTEKETVGCGLMNCSWYHEKDDGSFETIKSLALPTEKLDEDNLFCKALALVKDFCGEYNKVVESRKLVLALCWSAFLIFGLGGILGLLGACGKWASSHKHVSILAVLGGLCCVAALYFYATGVAGANIDQSSTKEDWDDKSFGLSFYAVAMASGVGFATCVLYALAPKIDMCH